MVTLLFIQNDLYSVQCSLSLLSHTITPWGGALQTLDAIPQG